MKPLEKGPGFAYMIEPACGQTIMAFKNADQLFQAVSGNSYPLKLDEEKKIAVERRRLHLFNLGTAARITEVFDV
jgi:hypothetical protein